MSLREELAAHDKDQQQAFVHAAHEHVPIEEALRDIGDSTRDRYKDIIRRANTEPVHISGPIAEVLAMHGLSQEPVAPESTNG